MFFHTKKLELPREDEALPGRATPLVVSGTHTVTKNPMKPPFPAHLKQVVVGMGCFWGAERMMWQQPGVWTTAVGYAGGFTQNPTYEEVCSGRTGHTEVVLVVYDPKTVTLEQLLKVFWEEHDPTQGMRQGNDVGTQYRSALYWLEGDDDTHKRALASRDAYAAALKKAGHGEVTTDLRALSPSGFYYAEEYHQQYLDKNPNGYCGLEGTGVACPVGVGVRA
jgi:peptide-methionine (S)-S-oxide reductase